MVAHVRAARSDTQQGMHVSQGQGQGADTTSMSCTAAFCWHRVIAVALLRCYMHDTHLCLHTFFIMHVLCHNTCCRLTRCVQGIVIL